MKIIYNTGHLKRKVQGLCLLHALFVFLFFGQSIYGQGIYTINGRISDSLTGETLIGVNIFLKDTKYGTVSDSKGDFNLEAPGGNYKLVFSYIGYKQKEVSLELNWNVSLNISLSPTETEIEEVTVTTQRKFFGNMDYGREIPTISTEVIEKQNVNNASDILHARLAGVWATKTSGAPGDHQKIRIRGQSSFFSSAEPLYVVDGVPVPIVNMSSLGIADLNIHDIENITVLKDASSTALYGFLGGNGVIIIDTKRGSTDNEIFFSTKIGFQKFSNYYDLMNTHDFLASLDSSQSLFRNPLRTRYPQYSDNLESINWQDEIFRVGRVNEYQLSGFRNISTRAIPEQDKVLYAFFANS
jgi:TonB-dependent SusC/RagA subfamily outer membrane receptor